MIAATRLAGCLLPLSILAGCASAPPPATQTLEVRVEADDPAWSGPLPCRASNSAGSWAFDAPGSVTVLASRTALQIQCTAPSGAAVDASRTAPGTAARADARKGAAAGAKVGAGAGVALGIAAAPVMGPAFAVLLAVGSAFKGAEIGGVVAAVSAGDTTAYPSPILLRIRRAAPAD